MSLITPYLYLGNANNAQDANFLKNKNVILVVNCAKEIQNYFSNHIEYIHLDWNDIIQQDIQKDLDFISNEIIKRIKKGKVVFVHCAAGISRSTSVVIYTIMKLHKWNYEKAYSFVKGLHANTNPNSSFVEQIKNMQFRETFQLIEDSQNKNTKIINENEKSTKIIINENTEIENNTKPWSKLTFDSSPNEMPQYIKMGNRGASYAKLFS